ncbi:MAG TPA: hypothetical protein VHU61_18665 [Solirubrobacteraceae bacterium]|jgi:hypothetical protein|nr:hypothetical protein [Solirubrobacteraceae bacterium]
MLAAVAVVSLTVFAPSGASARAGQVAAAALPATDAYTFPQECVVLPVKNKSFVQARGLLAGLGCRVRRVEHASSVRKGLVISAVGGTRSYAFGHVVTLIVSSGPPGT